MPAILTQVLAWLGGGVVVVAGLTGLAYWLFRQFAEKWLTNRFAEQLESHRKELAALLDRETRFHALEFEVLPEIWARLNDAFGKTILAFPDNITIPDLTNLSAGVFRNALALYDFDEVERQELVAVQPEHRNDSVLLKLHTMRCREARHSTQDLLSYYTRTAIFIEPSMRAEILGVAVELNNVLLGFLATPGQLESRPRWEASAASHAALRPRVNGLLECIHQRLWTKTS